MTYELNENSKQQVIDKMVENLPVFRQMLHLTQADLAALLGLNRQTYVCIEKKKRKMTWATFLSLMFVFSQNKETNKLLEFFNIYTEEMKKMYSDINT